MSKICPQCGSRFGRCVSACVLAKEEARRCRELDALEREIDGAESGVLQLEFEGDLAAQRRLVDRFVAECHRFEFVELIEPAAEFPFYLVNIARTRAGLGGALRAVYRLSDCGIERSAAHDAMAAFFVKRS